MKTYGKLENGNLISSYALENGRALTTIQINGQWVSNPDSETLIEGGYVELIYGEKPLLDEGQTLTEIYNDNGEVTYAAIY